MAGQQVYIFASITPKPGRDGEVERILRGMLAPTRAEPGCRRYDLFRDRGDTVVYHLFEAYDDFAAVEHHRSTEHYKVYRRDIESLLAEPVRAVLMNPLDVASTD